MYRRLLESAHIRVRRICVSSYAMAELARYNNEIPKSYVLCDLGAEVTNITLVGNSTIFETISFLCGAADLINKVANKFAIEYEDAFEIIRKYGLDERPLTYKPTIAKSNINGVEVHQDPETLNSIIKEFLRDEYFNKFDAAYETLMKGYPDNIRNLPIVFTGGLSKMIGFESLAKEKFESNASIHYLEPTCIGARDTSFSAVIGALYASSKYKGSLSDTRIKNSQQLQRVNEKGGA